MLSQGIQICCSRNFNLKLRYLAQLLKFVFDFEHSRKIVLFVLLPLPAFSRGGFKSYCTSENGDRKLRFRPLRRTSCISPIVALNNFSSSAEISFLSFFSSSFPSPFPSLSSSPLLLFFSSLCAGCRRSCRVHTGACKWRGVFRNVPDCKIQPTYT